ncbi:MAG: hypothetical protein QGG86_00010 [Candidatus Marinimicrobia bacterium]|nr:hypothetical protein [Candidatus Neomarinimicrobiota bacterium]
MFKEHLPAKFLCKFQPCRNIAANGINPPLKGFAVVGARHAASSAWVRLPPKPPPSIRYHYAQKPPPTLKPPSDHSCQSADLAHAKWLALWPMPNGWHFCPCQMVGTFAHAKWLAMRKRPAISSLEAFSTSVDRVRC